MQKKTIILISIVLSCFTVFNAVMAAKYYSQSQQLKNKIVELETKISKMSSENDELKKDSEFLNNQYENLKSNKTEMELIPVEVQECMKKENYTTSGMNHCVNISCVKFEKEIDKNISLLKTIMTPEQYELLEKSQKTWEEYKKAEWALNRETIGLKSGTIYSNILTGNQVYIVEKRAQELSFLYSELSE